MPDKRLEQDFKDVSSALNHFQEENEKLKAENAELRAEVERKQVNVDAVNLMERLNSDNEKLQSEVERLRESKESIQNQALMDLVSALKKVLKPEEFEYFHSVISRAKFNNEMSEALNHKPSEGV